MMSVEYGSIGFIANLFKKTLLASLAFFFVSFSFAQSPGEQHGVVRTVLRPGKKIEYLSGATIWQKGNVNAVVSGDKGKFVLKTHGLAYGDVFFLSKVKKNGYELADERTVGRAFAHSASPIEIVMINKAEMEADIERISDNAYKRAKELYESQNRELQKKLEEETITNEMYKKELSDLQNKYEKYESLINGLAEYYARVDYSTIDSLSMLINIAIENGELERADSLINSVGPLESLVEQSKNALGIAIDKLDAGRKAVDEAQADIENVRVNIDRLGNLLLGKYNICLSRFENDSAGYYIEMRANLDTLNFEWQTDAIMFLTETMLEFDKALEYAERTMRIARSKEYGNDALIAEAYQHTGVVHFFRDSVKDRKLAVEYQEKAIEIVEKSSAFEDADAIILYSSLAMACMKMADYKKAGECYRKAMTIADTVMPRNDKQRLGIITTYNGLGNFGVAAQDYDFAIAAYKKAVDSYLKFGYSKGPKYAVLLYGIGESYLAKGDMKGAEKHLQESYSLFRQAYFDRHPHCARSLHTLSKVYTETNTDLAIECCNKAIGIMEEYGNKSGLSMSNIYLTSAELYNLKGDRDSMQIYLEKASRVTYGLYDSYVGVGNVDMALMLYEALLGYYEYFKVPFLVFDDRIFELAGFYEQDGYKEDALKLYLEGVEKSSGLESSVLAGYYEKISLLYKECGNSTGSIDYMLKAIDLYEAEGNRLELLADRYYDVAGLYYGQQKYKEALAYKKKALSCYKKLPKRDNGILAELKRDIDELKELADK